MLLAFAATAFAVLAVVGDLSVPAIAQEDRGERFAAQLGVAGWNGDLTDGAFVSMKLGIDDGARGSQIWSPQSARVAMGPAVEVPQAVAEGRSPVADAVAYEAAPQPHEPIYASGPEQAAEQSAEPEPEQAVDEAFAPDPESEPAGEGEAAAEQEVAPAPELEPEPDPEPAPESQEAPDQESSPEAAPASQPQAQQVSDPAEAPSEQTAPTGRSVAIASAYTPDDGTGDLTAYGTEMDWTTPTVASPTLPLGSYVELTYEGASVVAQVTDRGPFVGDRTLDLAPGAYTALGFDDAYEWGVREIEWSVYEL